MSNLANCYSAHCQHEEALALEIEALALRRKNLPKDHPQITTSISNLAVTYGALGKHEEALPLKLEALEIRQRTLPEGHSDIANSMVNLANTYTQLGRDEEAAELRAKAGANTPTGVYSKAQKSRRVSLTTMSKPSPDNANAKSEGNANGNAEGSQAAAREEKGGIETKSLDDSQSADVSEWQAPNRGAKTKTKTNPDTADDQELHEQVAAKGCGCVIS